MGGLPAIAADERDVDAERAGLEANEGGFGVETGDGDDVGFEGAERSELGAEIFFAFVVFLLGDDLATAGSEVLAEDGGEADAVGGVDGGEEGDAFGFEGGVREFSEDGALEGIDETDAENVVADLGDAGVGRGDRHHGDLRILANGRGLEGVSGGIGADDGDDFVAGDEFFDRGGGLTLFRLDIFDEVGEGATEDAALGVNLLDGEEHAFAGGDAERGVLAGEGAVVAQFDCVRLARARREGKEGDGDGEEGDGAGEARPNEGEKGVHGSMVST